MRSPDDFSETLGSVPRASSCYRERATAMAIGLRGIAAASVAAVTLCAFAHGAELDQEEMASEDAIMLQVAPESATAPTGSRCRRCPRNWSPPRR